MFKDFFKKIRFSLGWTLLSIVIGIVSQSINSKPQAYYLFFSTYLQDWFNSLLSLESREFTDNISLLSFLFGEWYYFFFLGGILSFIFSIIFFFVYYKRPILPKPVSPIFSILSQGEIFLSHFEIKKARDTYLKLKEIYTKDQDKDRSQYNAIMSFYNRLVSMNSIQKD
jgi:hypothetical protein